MKNLNSKNSNNILSNNSYFVLYNTSNYKNTIDNSVSQILDKFIEVMIEYIKLISEKCITKNILHCRFVFEKGIETLIHVFSIIFYYTKNLDLTFYHTQKAYYFYIEFMEQISDDNVTFLQLSSQDAILFVYKKTIFDINNEHKKNINEPKQEEKLILDTVNSYMHIYKSIILFIINNKDFMHNDKLRHINIDYINNSCKSMGNINEILNKHKLKQSTIDCIHLFILLLQNNDTKIDTIVFFNLLDTFIKKVISKKKIDEKLIKNNICDLVNELFINNNVNADTIVEFIFTE